MSESPISWTRAIFKHSVKPHVMPTSFADEIIGEYQAQGFALHPGLTAGVAPIEARQIVTEAGNDIGGPCLIGRPEETFHVRGLAYGIACENVRVFYDSWHSEASRYTSVTRREYVKLKGVHCLVLEPADYRSLIRDMADRLEVAHARNEAFLVEWSRTTTPIQHPRISPRLTALLNGKRRDN